MVTRESTLEGALALFQDRAPLPFAVAQRRRKARKPATTFADIIPGGGTPFGPAPGGIPGIQAAGPPVPVGQALERALTSVGELIPGGIDDALLGLVSRGATEVISAAERVFTTGQAIGDVAVDVIGPPISALTGGALFPQFGAQAPVLGPIQSQGGAFMQPGQQLANLAAGAPLPAMGTIAKVWDTAPGPGVTGGGTAPIFIRTVDGRTFVRKLDGTIKKVPKSRNIVINTRKIDLNQYIRAEKRLDSISKRIAKRVRSLKRA